jgi:hypothetical protein
MTRADSVITTPPLNSSPIQDANPPREAHAESVDSFSTQRPPGDRPDERPASESRKPAGELPAALTPMAISKAK